MLLRPFKALIVKPSYAKEVSALPYDVYNREEAYEIAKENPLSFLHVDKAEIDIDRGINTYDRAVYERARDNFENLKDKVYEEETEEHYYIYELTMDGRRQVGIAGLASVDEYLNNVIKKHELTRKDKEDDRVSHIKHLNAQTGPVFLSYRSEDSLKSIIEEETKKEALYDFECGNVRHRFFKVDNNLNDRIYREFIEIKNAYIADGHHRAAAAARVALEMRKTKGQGEHDFFLCVIFPHDELYIMDYNRVIFDLNNLSEEEFLEKIKESFDVKVIGRKTERPKTRHEFGMYLRGSWYSLKYKREIGDDPVLNLDVSILEREVLNKILGIYDIRTDKRIDFIGGIRGTDELEKRAGDGVSFLMYPTSIEELFAVSDSNKIMPPKSTWFEPKLRSGLIAHKL